MTGYTGTEIAVIGLSGQFPGAKNIDEFWNNLQSGTESISFFSDDELISAGISPAVLKNPDYVKANAYIRDKEYFDAAFFGYLYEEAALMDPQIRLFQENCWKALEDAGINLKNNKKLIGLFAGGAPNNNWENYSMLANAKNLVDDFTASSLRNISFLCSRTSYLFDLQGPSIYINTACSTSLVAVQKACMSLLLRECAVALAGGVCIRNFSKSGYYYQEGMTNSKDGHCRTFDIDASGTVGGEGVGVAVLKRLSEAMADGDNIYAIIKGGAINNDGREKVSFAAPGVNGQYKAITKAIKMAGIEPASIGYVETNGTATKLGDSIEVEALKLAFGKSKKQHCALGSVKPNIGHLNTAAGIAGFIKVVLALKHKQIPPCIHFNTLNPEINLKESPFFINTELTPWHNDTFPLRAGVNSFGIGGTNVHVVLEEAPVLPVSGSGRDYHLLICSSKTLTALTRNIDNLKAYLHSNGDINIADLAYTLQTGRTPLEYRAMTVCASGTNILNAISRSRITIGPKAVPDKRTCRLVFIFPGQGVQYAYMCHELYEKEFFFRQEMDKCFATIKEIAALDPGDLFCSHDPLISELLLFAMEYALAGLLIKWGICPDSMIGHGIGEFAASCISNAILPQEAVRLLLKRHESMRNAGENYPVNASEKEDIKFWKGIQTLCNNKEVVFVEVGPGRIVSRRLSSNTHWKPAHKIINTVRQESENISDQYYLLSAIGELWLNGIEPDWMAYYEKESRRKLSLPSYSFDKIKFPADVDAMNIMAGLLGGRLPAGYEALISEMPVEPDHTIDNTSIHSVEERLVILWRNFFRNPAITAEDDFFQIGGDSLKALTMIERIHQSFDVKVPFKELFARPSIKDLSEYIRSEKMVKAES